MEFHVYENARAACEAAGVLIAAQITRKGDSVLGLATGSTPIPAYEMLTQWYDRGVIDFDRVRTFNLDEYVGINHKNPLSYHAFMQEHLFSKVNLRPENVHLPSGNGAADAEAYDKAIHDAGGIDIQLLGIGRNGHIGFNEPGADFAARTRVVALEASTLEANSAFFGGALPPTKAMTMGIGTILDSREIIVLATGETKRDAVRAALAGPIGSDCPATALRRHGNVSWWVDAESGAGLAGEGLAAE